MLETRSFEITTLLIPGMNDSEEKISAMTEWIAENLGVDILLHFTAFHPEHKLKGIARTPHETLFRAGKAAKASGLETSILEMSAMAVATTFRPACEASLIVRDWHDVLECRIAGGCCPDCGTRIPGRFDEFAAG